LFPIDDVPLDETMTASRKAKSSWPGKARIRNKNKTEKAIVVELYIKE
jgi:hypothetical protein